jgi:hypothetical protein
MEALNYYLIKDNLIDRIILGGPDEFEKMADTFYPDTIWLMRYVQPIFDPKDTLRGKVEKIYHKVGEYDFRGVVVVKYGKYN